MKAIVANLLAGVFLLVIRSPAWADWVFPEQEPNIARFSLATNLGNQNPWLSHDVTDFTAQISNYVIFLEDKENLSNIFRQNNWLPHQNFISFPRATLDRQLLSLGKNPYTYHHDRQDIILGLHHDFWSSNKNQKYYGLTTIEQWGNSSTQNFKLNKLNYLESAPILPQGTSALTLSGGGTKNLIQKNYLLEEFPDFRGGIAFHQGLAEDLTLGVGFVYEDVSVSGFSQLIYQPRNFPLKTTLSLTNSQEGFNLYSHLQLNPVKTFSLNFYGNEAQQKFALDWKISSALNFVVKTEVSSNEEQKWQLTSKLGHLRLTYQASNAKNNYQIDYSLGNFIDRDWQSSMFLKNQSRINNNNAENLAIWGWHLQSNSKINPQKHLWQFDLGYGIGSQGTGVIMSAAALVKPGLYLKLSYESVSLTSDTPKIKLDLSSIR